MLKTRVIASLLIQNKGLIKTQRFKNPTYIGDPINAVRIFSDKEADELVILDTSASARGAIDFELLERISREAFMPMGYGGGVRTVEDLRRILGMGFEKIVLNHAALENPDLISEAANVCGTSSVVVCLDTKRDLLHRHRVYDHTTGKTLGRPALEWAQEATHRGAGEILLYDANRDGTYKGYDLELISSIAHAVSVPVIALGGASSITDFAPAVAAGASAVAAGSIFVYHGPHRAVLITYPSKAALRDAGIS